MANHLRDYTILAFAPWREFVDDKLTGGESHVKLLWKLGKCNLRNKKRHGAGRVSSPLGKPRWTKPNFWKTPAQESVVAMRSKTAAKISERILYRPDFNTGGDRWLSWPANPTRDLQTSSRVWEDREE